MSAEAAPATPVLLAVDIGPKNLSAGLMSTSGELLDRGVTAADPDVSAGALFEALDAVVQTQLLRAAEHHRVRPVAVGIGCTGVVAPSTMVVSPVGIPAWRDFPLGERLVGTTKLPVFGDSASKALALAEGWLGSAVGHDSFVIVSVDSTIGGGVVLNGQMLEGATGQAGHIGHVIVEPNGRRCVCGARGCLDAEASGAAIEAITGRPTSEPTYDIMQRTGHLVGRAAASVCNVLDLDLVVVGGAVALGFGATFFNAAQESLDELAKVSYARGARVTPTRLGDRGPLVGAGAVAVRGVRRHRRDRQAASPSSVAPGQTDSA